MLNVILAGHGFYSLGNEHGNGGTIFAGILRWLSKEHEARVKLTILVRDQDSEIRATEKIRRLISKIQVPGLVSRIEVEVLGQSNLQSSNYDFGIIATPEHTHMKFVHLFSRICGQILCVKPFGVAAEDTEEALELEKSTGVGIYVEFHKRFDLANQQFVGATRDNLAGDCWFGFRYGQKSSVPLKVFQKWAHKSNPFQYLAPHYLDLIFLALQISPGEASRMRISGNVEALYFEPQPDLVSLVSTSLSIQTERRKILIESTCNWMEPESVPFPSRQEIEFQSAACHLYSRQDNRGQRFYTQQSAEEPNPQFHIQDEQFFAAGYGPESIAAFLSARPDQRDLRLAKLEEYLPTARVIDYVNRQIAGV